MKLFFTILISGFTSVGFSQSGGLPSIIADSGKVEFKKQADADNPDYTLACRILKNQVNQFPDSAELHYFLGYAIDRLNSTEGSTMHQMKKELVIEASEHFEKVNTLQPIYTGEYIVLDPYAKLSSIWGSLAQSYRVRNLKDAALWAFTEGKKRGGFTEPTLHYNRQLLNSCSKNAIFVTLGDNVTIPVWYLQTVENFRTDITIVDANLINTDWYGKYLKNVVKLPISFTDEEIEKIDFIKFEKRNITITNPADSLEKFTWELRPTYLDNYILKGDRILLNILKENLFSRDIYFSSNSDSSSNLFLGNYMHNEGLVSKIRLKGIDFNEAADRISTNFSAYNIDNLDSADIAKSKDAIIILNTYRWAYFANIARLIDKGQKPKARILRNEMEAKFPLDKLPYAFPRAAVYFDKLFSELD
ncbi:MAG: hypothetical protein IPL84_02120 [Chitinophagaceae bacterium]|nr:hypothetical protein [Chitinophagaceae bacterium]